METMNAIEVKNLTKDFESTQVVNQINFQVKSGETFGFLGPNGAGKTTSIRMITGVLKPTTGSIRIFGKDVWKNLLSIKQIISTVPEMANIFMDLTAWDNIELIGKLYSIPRRIRHQRAKNLLQEFGLYEKRKLKAKKFSKGMKQRLLLCMALICNPKILFLDEPTSGLDVSSSRIIKRRLKQYSQQWGITIFVTTHNMQVAKELCTRVAILNHGQIIRLDSPETLCRSEELSQTIDIIFEEETDIGDLEGLPKNVKGIENCNGVIRFFLDDLHEGLQQVISYLNKKMIRIQKISTHEPNLEDIFIKLVNEGKNNEI